MRKVGTVPSLCVNGHPITAQSTYWNPYFQRLACKMCISVGKRERFCKRGHDKEMTGFYLAKGGRARPCKVCAQASWRAYYYRCKAKK